MATDGWLPCTGLKEGYFSRDEFIQRLREQLFPALRAKYGPATKVIVLDNLSVHVDNSITNVIEQEGGHLVRYLPPYSPDFNPIELSFGIIKAWIKRNFHWLRPGCANFGAFMRLAIEASNCDQYARRQFKHAANGLYIEQEELDRVREALREYEGGHFNALEGALEGGQLVAA